MHPSRMLLSAAVLAVLATTALAQSTTTTGVSRESNPAISINTLLLGRVADESAATAVNGVDLQEAEVQITSVVDPYWLANLVFAVHPEHDDGHGDEGHDDAAAHDHGGGYTGHVEVAYIDGTALPWGLGLRLGKDYLPFGKHVPLHTHQFPFVDAPVAVRAFLGDHGLTEVGARLSRALPLPWWSDLTVYAVDGQAPIFDADSRDLVYGARWSNLFDLGLESTLELGGSWLRGPQNDAYLLLEHGHEDEVVPTTEASEHALLADLDVIGADATFKWVSSERSRGPALNLTGEIVLPDPEQVADRPFGWFAFAQYRFARNWWLGAGVGGLDRDLAHDEHAHEEEEHAEEEEHDAAHGGLWAWEEVFEAKLNLTWAPSEFSFVRAEVARYEDQMGDADEWLVSLQANFTIGSHPAHQY